VPDCATESRTNIGTFLFSTEAGTSPMRGVLHDPGSEQIAYRKKKTKVLSSLSPSPSQSPSVRTRTVEHGSIRVNPRY
jgi:hypothetical protein